MIDDRATSSLNQIIVSSHSIVYNNTDLGTIYMIKKDDGKTSDNPKEEEDKSSNDLNRHFRAAKSIRQKTSRNPYTGGQPS